MRPARHTRRLPCRHRAAAVVAVVAQLFAAVGLPLPALGASSAAKRAGASFPCQNHPCGCLTAEACWAGACCCYTMREKVAWAAARKINPPAHAVQLAEAEECPEAACPNCPKKPAACCAGDAPGEKAQPEARPVRWVFGMSAQKCRGETLGGIAVQTPAVSPAAPVVWSFEPVLVATLAARDHTPEPLVHIPPSPPPKA